MRNSCIWLLVAAPYALSACASTSGRAWVREPEDANLDTDAANVELSPLPEGAATVALDERAAEDAVEVRPRLAHVVSLGESESGSGRAAGPVTGAPPAPGVVVNIVNYGSSAYAGGYGYPLSYRTSASGAPVVHSAPAASGAPALGGDWRPAPSYGPSFPWHTGPAPAWEPRR